MTKYTAGLPEDEYVGAGTYTEGEKRVIRTVESNLEKMLAQPITEVICAWCTRSKTHGDLVQRGTERYNSASHGMCKDCSGAFVVPKGFIRRSV